MQPKQHTVVSAVLSDLHHGSGLSFYAYRPLVSCLFLSVLPCANIVRTSDRTPLYGKPHTYAIDCVHVTYLSNDFSDSFRLCTPDNIIWFSIVED